MSAAGARPGPLRSHCLLLVGFALPGLSLGAESMDQHMLEHFVAATQIQTAVIEADLSTARERAQWLAGHSVSRLLPESSLPDLEMMQAEAGRVAQATTLEQAAEATARMAVACGGCHRSMDVNTGLDSNVPMDTGAGLTSRMDRHLWAADRLWEGLIGPSDQAWQDGAEALLEAPLTGDAVLGEANADVDAIGQRIRSIAEMALGESSRQRRASLYGRFLAECANCHRRHRPDR